MGLYGLGGVSVLRSTCSMNSCVLLFPFASYTATRGITSLACHPLAGMSESMPQMADTAVQRAMQAQMPIICAWPGLDELRHFGMANDMAKPSLNRPFTPELLLQLATLKLEVFIVERLKVCLDATRPWDWFWCTTSRISRLVERQRVAGSVWWIQPRCA